jgi:hypothetical protein
VNIRRVATGVCALAMCCAFSTDAWAQREAGPFAGLFGGGKDASDARQTFTLDWSGYGGYDDTVLDQSVQLAADPRFQKSGEYGGLSLGLGFARNTGRNRLNIDGGAGVRAYGATRDVSAPTYTLSTAFAIAPTRGTTIEGSFGGSYSSFYQFAPFLAAEPSGNSDVPTYGFAAVNQQSRSTSVGVGLSQRLSSRILLSTNVGWNRIRYQSANADAARLDGRSASFGFRGNVSRDLAFRAGYGYREGLFGEVPTIQAVAVIHDLDIGLDYSRALSISRRTTLQFGSGSSIVESQDRVRHFRLNGQAALTQEIRRTWTATLSYARSTQFVHGFTDVVIADGVTAGLGGLLASRLQFVTSAGYSIGQIGLDATRSRFTSYTGSGKFVVALSPVVGMYAQYLYYHYDIPPSSSAFGELPPRLGRQALTFGLNGTLPFMKDTRSPRDSR